MTANRIPTGLPRVGAPAAILVVRDKARPPVSIDMKFASRERGEQAARAHIVRLSSPSTPRKAAYPRSIETVRYGIPFVRLIRQGLECVGFGLVGRGPRSGYGRPGLLSTAWNTPFGVEPLRSSDTAVSLSQQGAKSKVYPHNASIKSLGLPLCRVSRTVRGERPCRAPTSHPPRASAIELK